MHYLHGFLCKNAFFECANILLANKNLPFDTHGARHVLARTLVYSEIIDVYGCVLALLLTHSVFEDDAFYIETDAHLLVDFIKTATMTSVLLVAEPTSEAEFPSIAISAMHQYDDFAQQGLEFVRVFMRTSLNFEAKAAHKVFTLSPSPTEQTPLDAVMSSLSYSSQAHPALVFMVEHRLGEPASILHKLLGKIEAPIERVELTNTASFAFLAALRPLVASGKWLAETSQQHAQLLLAHAHRQNKHADAGIEWEESFLLILINNPLCQLHDKLQYLVDQNQISHKVVDSFFPLSLQQCNIRKVLPQVAKFYVQAHAESTIGKAGVFLRNLKKHHYELAKLLQLHFSVWKTHGEAMGNLSCIQDGFEVICNGPSSVAKNAEPINSDVFG